MSKHVHTLPGKSSPTTRQAASDSPRSSAFRRSQPLPAARSALSALVAVSVLAFAGCTSDQSSTSGQKAVPNQDSTQTNLDRKEATLDHKKAPSVSGDFPAGASATAPTGATTPTPSATAGSQNDIVATTNALVGTSSTSTGETLGDYHLDPDPQTLVRRPRRSNRTGELELTLRSSPPGAIASIDGQPIGPTPAYWSGAKTSGPREFTFALAGYAVARYRFVPTKSGIVHGTLRRLVAPPADAGSTPPPSP